MENGISLRMVSFCTRIGVRMEQTPTTTIRLKILEPTTLLTASSLLLTSDAVTLTAVSGRDVPIATIVRPMMIGGTFSLFAILELLLQRNPHPSSGTQSRSQEKLTQGSVVNCLPDFPFFFSLSVFISHNLEIHCRTPC